MTVKVISQLLFYYEEKDWSEGKLDKVVRQLSERFTQRMGGPATVVVMHEDRIKDIGSPRTLGGLWLDSDPRDGMKSYIAIAGVEVDEYESA